MSQEPCTLFWPRSGFTPTPSRPTLPVAIARFAMRHDHRRALAVLGDAEAVVDRRVRPRGVEAGRGPQLPGRDAGDRRQGLRAVLGPGDERRPVGEASSSQRSATKSSSTRPSVTTTCAMALITATLVPGCSWRWYEASTCGVRTRSMRRGSITTSFAPSRSRRFIREAKTGWASVGLAPMTTMTSAWSTERKSCVPAEVPNVCFRP